MQNENSKLIKLVLILASVAIVITTACIVVTITQRKNNPNIESQTTQPSTIINTTTQNAPSTSAFSIPSTTESPSTSTISDVSSTTSTTSSSSTTTNSTTSSASTTQKTSTTTSTTKKVTKADPVYKYAEKATQEGYKNLRNCSSTDLKAGNKYFFEVKYDSPDMIISRKSIDIDSGTDYYTTYDVKGTKVLIPIPSKNMNTEYCFIKGIIIKVEYNGETCLLLAADSNYIYKGCTKEDLTGHQNVLEW